MREDLKYPSIDAVKSVLNKIGVDASTRFDEFDQDHEYTTCVLDELEDYVKLYQQSETSIYEKRVLGCYFLECLNEFIESNNAEHVLQCIIFKLLYADTEIHKIELEYWADMSDSNKENWWPITEYLIKWQRTYKGRHNRPAKRRWAGLTTRCFVRLCYRR